jgi:hypothetical protein
MSPAGASGADAGRVSSLLLHFGAVRARTPDKREFLVSSVKPFLRRNNPRAARFRIAHVVRSLRELVRSTRGHPRIVFYPHFPTRKSAIDRACRYAGFAMSNNPRRRADILVKWTGSDGWSEHIPELEVRGREVVNGNLRSIGKQHCMNVFEEVFEVPFEIDPTTHYGPAIRKSDGNARHDAVILDCPIRSAEVVAGQVYQRYIDTIRPDGLMEELRVVVVGSKAVLTFVKHRRPDRWFDALENDRVALLSPDALFSSMELDNLHRFSEDLGLDYGEMDVLRDRDGQIFVTDVNPTPFGPPNALKPAAFAASSLWIGYALADAYGPSGMALSKHATS